MRFSRNALLATACGGVLVSVFTYKTAANVQQASPIWFQCKSIPFHLENDETPVRHIPAAMPGGVAILDYNRDGKPDIFFTNGGDLKTLKKDSPKYYNRLFRNDGNGKFTDVTKEAGLEGSGYDIGVAVADYDNDGYPDIFVAGVYRSTLYHNNGDGTFTDVTAKAGLDHWNDPQYGPLWAVGAAWVDVNNDGKLDLFVVNYLRWNVDKEPRCTYRDVVFYCHPKFYEGLPNQLFLNNGNGTFTDVSAQWGVRSHVAKGMGVAMADYDGDGRPDLFVTSDNYYNSLFHNVDGRKFDEVAFDAGVALIDSGQFVSGMGVDFRDYNNDSFPDLAYVTLTNDTFPLYRNTGKAGFEEVTAQSGLAKMTRPMSAYGVGLYDFDNDGWKDMFITRGHVDVVKVSNELLDQYNTVFRNIDHGNHWEELTEQAGLNARPAARHRGCAFGDLDGDGRIDVVATALDRDAEIWMNRSPDSGNWIEFALEGTRSNRDGIGAVLKLTSKNGVQYNHMTSAVGYASSSYGPVHFGLGKDTSVVSVEIRWPSGTVQKLDNLAVNRVVNVKEPR